MDYAQSSSFPVPDSRSPAAKDDSSGPDLTVRLICPTCTDPNPHLFEQFGDRYLVCVCDLALGDQKVDSGSEWGVVVQTFATGEHDGPSLVGSPSNALEGMEQLATVISSQDGSTTELGLDESMLKDLRLRHPLSVFQNIAQRCHHFLESETICDIAKQLYKRTFEAKLLRGKPLDVVIAACIFAACRQAHIPRTFREICDIMCVSKKLLGFCYKTLVREFDLTPGVSINPSGSPSTRTETLLARYYCDHLNLSTRVHSVCTAIIVSARKHGIAVGRSPASIAAGGIYYTSYLLGELRTVRDICAVASVSESTLRLVYRLFHASRAKLVKQEWLDEERARASLPV